jgi:hypothetical protein
MSAAERVALGLDRLQAGTFEGEAWRSFIHLKSVPFGFMRAHWLAMHELESPMSRAVYAAKYTAGAVASGAVASVLLGIENGQNPKDMSLATAEGRKFWMEAMLRGGALGIAGDIINPGRPAFQTGVDVLLGPTASLATSVIQETNQAIQDAAADDPSKHEYARAAVRITRQNLIPFSQVWWGKAAFNRLVYDQMQDALVPGSSWKQQQRMQRQGVSYWWRPGELTPDSAPTYAPQH